jgi:hypothetical protein
MGIAGATGSSAGAAHIVPALLMDEVRVNSKSLLGLADLELLRQEPLEDQNCYVLQGSLFKKGDHLLWISTDDFSLCRIFQDKSLTDEESKTSYDALQANDELVARLSARGIAPPPEMKHVDRRYCTDFRYTNLSFDAPVSQLPHP